LPPGATLSAGTAVLGSYTLTPAQLNGLKITAPAAGINLLVFTATAQDTSGQVLGTATALSTLALTTNFPPVASNGVLLAQGLNTAAGTLVASDPEGEALTYAIVTAPALGTVTITNASTGAYTYTPNENTFASDTFTFMASDANGVSNVATITVTLQASGTPTAVINASSLNLINSGTVTFDGTGSGPDVVNYAWNFGDGSSVSGNAATAGNVSHTYDAPGRYIVTLTVTNGGGAQGIASVTVVVTGALLSGKLNASGAAQITYDLTLPQGVIIGSSFTLTIGGFTTMFTLVNGKGKSKAGTVTTNGLTLNFKLKSSASALFGTSKPTGTQSVVVTVSTTSINSYTFTEPVTFKTSGKTTTFK
jgi:PKD repeat protein